MCRSSLRRFCTGRRRSRFGLGRERVGRGGDLRVDGQREAGEEEGGLEHGDVCLETVICGV